MPLSHRAPAEVRTIRCLDGLAIAEVGPICVVIWRDAVNLQRFEDQKVALSDVVRHHPTGSGFLCVIEPTAGAPDDTLRKASVEMVNSHGTRLKCIACVVEGTGFRAAVARSVLSGMVLLTGQTNAPLSIFGHVPAGAQWMKGHLDFERPFVTAAVEALRKELDVATPGRTSKY